MKSVSGFLQEVFKELKKVEWPSVSDFWFSFILTIILVILFSLFFAGVDGVIAYGMKVLLFATT